MLILLKSLKSWLENGADGAVRWDSSFTNHHESQAEFFFDRHLQSAALRPQEGRGWDSAQECQVRFGGVHFSGVSNAFNSKIISKVCNFTVKDIYVSRFSLVHITNFFNIFIIHVSNFVNNFMQCAVTKSCLSHHGIF